MPGIEVATLAPEELLETRAGELVRVVSVDADDWDRRVRAPSGVRPGAASMTGPPARRRAARREPATSSTPGERDLALTTFHHANEELLLVVAGTPTVRHAEGERVSPVMSSSFGEARKAHQIANRTDEPCRFLMVSTMNGPEISVYPDSEKVGVFDRAPGPGETALASCGRTCR